MADEEAVLVYLRFKALFGGSVVRRGRKHDSSERPAESVPYGAGREPRGLGSIVESLSSQLGWDSPLAQSELLSSWPRVAGAETAEHSEPIGIADGVLTVQCDSTSWATQLRIMRGHLLTSIESEFPHAGVTSIRFQGPGVPSWKRGPRSIPGRGPRDTYG